MNNGYSRMGVISPDDFTAQSRSSPTFSPPPKELAKQKEADGSAKPDHGHFTWKQEDQEGGARFGVIMLSRSCSSASQRFANGSTTLQAAVKRAFSMRKSSSVREGYWRIHGTGDEDGQGELMEEEEGEEQQQQQMRCAGNKKKGKFLRACKRLLGF